MEAKARGWGIPGQPGLCSKTWFWRPEVAKKKGGREGGAREYKNASKQAFLVRQFLLTKTKLHFYT